MSDHGSGALRRALAAMALLLSIGSVARADIVWEGKRVSAWPDIADRSARATYAAPGFYPAPSGTVFGLTILVDFSDQAPAFTKAQVEDWLNKPGYSVGGGSVRDYFFDVSNGAVTFQNDVVGFYRAKQPKSHYESGTGYAGSDELWAELVEALDPMIDFSKYDNDKNGKTEAISVVYAGPSKTWGQGLWPHASGSRQVRDGVTLTRYMFTQMGNQLELYVYAHETSHMLFGWPDLYGFGDYCLMGNAQSPTNPVGINDFYRADQGWIPQVDITADTNARYAAMPNGGGFRYVNPKRNTESFFWSNVQNTGRFKSLRGSGILVLHFDRNIARNDPPNPLSLDVVEADGRSDLSATMWPRPGSAASDFYVQGGNALLSDTSMPAARWNDGSSTGLKLYEISASGTRMTFAVGTGTAPPEVLDGGVPPGADAGPSEPPTDGGAAGSVGAPTAGSAGSSQPTMDGGVAGSAGAAGNAGASGNAGTGGASGSSGGASAAGGSPATTAPVGSGAGGTAGPSAGVSGALPGTGAAPATGIAGAPSASANDEASGCAITRPGTTTSAGRSLATWLVLAVFAAWLGRNRRR